MSNITSTSSDYNYINTVGAEGRQNLENLKFLRKITGSTDTDVNITEAKFKALKESVNFNGASGLALQDLVKRGGLGEAKSIANINAAVNFYKTLSDDQRKLIGDTNSKEGQQITSAINAIWSKVDAKDNFITEKNALGKEVKRRSAKFNIDDSSFNADSLDALSSNFLNTEGITSSSSKLALKATNRELARYAEEQRQVARDAADENSSRRQALKAKGEAINKQADKHKEQLYAKRAGSEKGYIGSSGDGYSFLNGSGDGKGMRADVLKRHIEDGLQQQGVKWGSEEFKNLSGMMFNAASQDDRFLDKVGLSTEQQLESQNAMFKRLGFTEDQIDSYKKIVNKKNFTKEKQQKLAETLEKDAARKGENTTAQIDERKNIALETELKNFNLTTRQAKQEAERASEAVKSGKGALFHQTKIGSLDKLIKENTAKEEQASKESNKQLNKEKQSLLSKVEGSEKGSTALSDALGEIEKFKENYSGNLSAKEQKQYNALVDKATNILKNNSTAYKTHEDAQESIISYSENYGKSVEDRSKSKADIDALKNEKKLAEQELSKEQKQAKERLEKKQTQMESKTEETKTKETKKESLNTESTKDIAYSGNIGTKAGQNVSTTTKTSDGKQVLSGEVTVNLVVDDKVVQQIVAKINSKK